MSIMASLTSLVSLGGRVYELSKATQDIELKEAIVDLRSKLLDVKNEVIDLNEENTALKAEIQRLNKPPEMVFRNGKYQSADGLEFYCVGCFDGQGKKVRLIKTPRDFVHMVGPLSCPVCQNGYDD